MFKRKKKFQVHFIHGRGSKVQPEICGYEISKLFPKCFCFSPQFCSFQYKPREACYFFRLVCKDICNGQENICIPATNVIDVPPMAPEGMVHFSTCTRLFLLLSYATTNGMVKC